MKFACILLILALTALPAAGETLRVRIDDLGARTRVVIVFDELPSWYAGRTDDGYAIALGGDGGLHLDNGPIIHRRPIARLAGIHTDAKTRVIGIGLTCECWARIYEHRGSSLVIDIEDGPPGSDAAHEAEFVRSGTYLKGTKEGRAVASPVEAFIQSDNPLVLPSRDQTLNASRRSPTMPPKQQPGRLPGQTHPSFDLSELALDPGFTRLGQALSDPHDSYAVEVLSRELSRAVAQGLVDAPDLNASRVDPPRRTVDSSIGESNLVATTAIDRDAGLQRDRSAASFAGSVCLPNAEFDFSGWGDPSDRALLGSLRVGLFEEDGTPDEPNVIDMIHYYLSLGFGAEARRLTDLISDESRRELLSALAEIMDHGRTESRVFDGQIVCKGKVALWAMLARPIALAEKPAETNDILSAFSELPLHVRVHLGPVLSERLRDLGFEAEAHIALNAVTRGGSNTPAQHLTAARLGLSGTNAEAARDELQNLSRGTDLIAAKALFELLLDAERRGDPPRANWVADAPSLVRATQGTQTAAALNLAGLRGRIALGQFDALRAALNEWSPGLDDAARQDLASAAIAAASEMADAPTFLRTELALSKVADPTRIPYSAKLTLTDRLIVLGLPERALTYLSDFPETAEERRLKSGALADLQQFDAAIDLMSESSSPDLLDVLGHLLMRDGRVAEAVAVFARAANTDAASTAAIRNADWAWLESNADPALSEASRTLQEAARPAAADTSGGNADLLHLTASRRAQIQVLLDRTELAASGEAFTN